MQNIFGVLEKYYSFTKYFGFQKLLGYLDTTNLVSKTMVLSKILSFGSFGNSTHDLFFPLNYGLVSLWLIKPQFYDTQFLKNHVQTGPYFVSLKESIVLTLVHTKCVSILKTSDNVA